MLPLPEGELLRNMRVSGYMILFCGTDNFSEKKCPSQNDETMSLLFSKKSSRLLFVGSFLDVPQGLF